ncbi:hypothetical protein CA13_68040 [Planctomycetes bacterium CA13]|uniref:Uncharacterized protein n=1 Tax=Novipirellula herctigrandis TaxID=2527986 RepID=A0A5C5YN08_9BACT|nr:hypothetical protein CA13_68040 [Planctomycetes bacterium CA13]
MKWSALMIVIAALVSVALLSLGPVFGQATPRDGLLPPLCEAVTIPTTKNNTLGFVASVTLAERDLVGTVPVRIVVRSTTTFPADRELVFRFASSVNGQAPVANGLEMDVPVSLLEGTKQSDITRYLPKWSLGDGYDIRVLEDARFLENCDAKIENEIVSRRDAMLAEYALNWTYIAESDQVKIETLPDIRSLVLVRGQVIALDPSRAPKEQPQYWDMFLQTSRNRHLASIVGQANLPTDWRGYLGTDLIVISQAGLEITKTNGHFQAIRDFVLSGGTIAITETSSEAVFVDLFGLAEQTPSELTAVKERETAYTLDELKNIRSTYEQGIAQLLKPNRSGSLETLPGFSWNSAERPIDDSAQAQLEWFQTQNQEMGRVLGVGHRKWIDELQVRRLGMGMVFGFAPSVDDPFKNVVYWKIIDRIVSHRASPTLRRGVDPILGDRRFFRWTVPGVAQPPVYTFMGLLTLFVILVGPVAYRMTARRGRSYLMFLIAPVLAIVTTVTMFAYGIVADGFGTSARVRQLTWVDGASGDASERIQSTYFAGLRPSEGLSFGPTSEVMRYPDGSAESLEKLESRPPEILGRITLTENSQQFDSSFLPSRQQRQFVVHRPRHDIGGVSIHVQNSDDVGSTASVSNDLGMNLRGLVIRDSTGKYWQAERVESDPRRLTLMLPLTSKEASQAISDLYNEFRPIDLVVTSRKRNANRSRRYTNDLVTTINEAKDFPLDRSSTYQNVLDGSFEFWLNETLKLQAELPKSHFVAISDVSKDVIVVEGTQLVDSVRYVFGTLRNVEQAP